MLYVCVKCCEFGVFCFGFLKVGVGFDVEVGFGVVGVLCVRCCGVCVCVGCVGEGDGMWCEGGVYGDVCGRDAAGRERRII